MKAPSIVVVSGSVGMKLVTYVLLSSIEPADLSVTCMAADQHLTAASLGCHVSCYSLPLSDSLVLASVFRI